MKIKKSIKRPLKSSIIVVSILCLYLYQRKVNDELKVQLELLKLQVEDINVSKQIIEQSEWSIPCSTSSSKSYMLSSSITDKSSKQYELISGMKAKDGLLLDDEGYIGVALGSWFGELGTRYVFKLSSGVELYVVKVEEKDDKDTLNGCEHKIDKSVIEFVIDDKTNTFEYGDNNLILNGNFDNHEWFKGDIINMRREVSK